MESRLLNSKKTIVATYVKQIINLILQFASRTVFIQVLGAQYLGIGSLFKNILQFLSLADLGFTTAMAYSFYEPLAENDEDRIAALINFYKKIYRVIAAVILGLGLLCVPVLKHLVNVETDIPYLNTYYIFYLLNTVTAYLCVYKTTLLTAAQRGYVLAKLQTIVNIVFTVGQIVGLVVFRNYFVYLILMVTSTLIQNVYPSFVAGRMFPYIKRKVGLQKQEIREMFLNIKAVFVYKVSGKFVTSTDNILISVLVGTTIVGYYSNYQMIIDNITVFVTAIFTSITASVGNMLVSKDSECKKYQTFKIEQTAAAMISTMLVCCFTLLANDFITVWAGKSFTLSAASVGAIGLNFYLTCIFQPLWSYREAGGLYRKTQYINMATAVVNTVLSVLLGLKFGVAGILIATPVSKLATYFWYEPPILYKDYFSAPVKEYYLSILKSVFWLLIILTVCYYAGERIAVNSWGTWLLKALVTFGISAVITVLAYAKSSEFKLLIKKVLLKK